MSFLYELNHIEKGGKKMKTAELLLLIISVHLNLNKLEY